MAPQPTLDRLDQKLEDLALAFSEFVARFNKHDDLERVFQNDIYARLLKLDRLEQVELARRWHIRTIWGAWIAALIGWLFSLFRGLGK